MKHGCYFVDLLPGTFCEQMKKLFIYHQQQIVNWPAGGQRCTAVAFRSTRNAKKKKSRVYLTEDQLAPHLFRRYDEEEEEMSRFPSLNALFTFHTRVKPRLILIKRTAHADTHHAVYLNNEPL